MIRLQPCKKYHPFPILLLTFAVLIIGCATNRNNRQNTLTGNWKWTMREGNATVKGTSTFHDDGTLHHHGSIIVKVGDKTAMCDFWDSLKWKLEDNYLIELPQTLPQYSNFRGDPEVVELAREGLRRDGVREEKSKLLHLSKDNCVLLIDHNGEMLELILSRMD